jgi:hypothetical protein
VAKRNRRARRVAAVIGDDGAGFEIGVGAERLSPTKSKCASRAPAKRNDDLSPTETGYEINAHGGRSPNALTAGLPNPAICSAMTRIAA